MQPEIHRSPITGREHAAATSKCYKALSLRQHIRDVSRFHYGRHLENAEIFVGFDRAICRDTTRRHVLFMDAHFFLERYEFVKYFVHPRCDPNYRPRVAIDAAKLPLNDQYVRAVFCAERGVTKNISFKAIVRTLRCLTSLGDIVGGCEFPSNVGNGYARASIVIHREGISGHGAPVPVGKERDRSANSVNSQFSFARSLDRERLPHARSGILRYGHAHCKNRSCEAKSADTAVPNARSIRYSWNMFDELTSSRVSLYSRGTLRAFTVDRYITYDTVNFFIVL